MALSELFNLAPIDIPMHAPPGEAPKLAKGWGHISISHCNNALLIGWSLNKLGIDIENANRSLQLEPLANRFLSRKENHDVKTSSENTFYKNILSRWVIKEAAIKWQRGNLFKDLREWEIDKNCKYAYHKSLGIKVNIQLIDYHSWLIAIASNKEINLEQAILCVN